jgi:hypothetical protein
MCRIYFGAILAALTLSAPVHGDADSVGVSGINAIGLKRPNGSTLTGSGVPIGQVETSRVSQRGFDSAANSTSFVVPTEIRTQDGDAPFPNVNVGDGHATEVASVIIGTGSAPTSVAPGASLYSSGFISSGITPGYADSLMTTQYIAKRFPFSNPQHIRAINHSWAKLSTTDPPDANSLLTLGRDWIASTFDVLNVFAGATDDDSQRAPNDNYNGITVAYSTKAGGVYRQVDPRNDNGDFDDAQGTRVSVDIMAPGDEITVATIGATNPTVVSTGTSFAVPHVVGTVALLNQFADDEVFNSVPRWGIDNSRKHEVMKAVLLNSADKISGVHGSLRNVVAEDGTRTWTSASSIAFTNDAISLDQEMGAGHLNAARALRQFRSGEYDNGASIPKIGWDFGETGGEGSIRSYPFSVPLSAGYVAITLAWDREVVKLTGDEDTYDPSDIFQGQDPDDLNVFLAPTGWDDLLDDAIAKSVSQVDNVEHIFESVPPGNYEIVVTQDVGDFRTYGLAWWSGSNTPGDFDDDGDVDGGDFGQWKGDFGQNGESDADFDGDSDGGDFLAWQRNRGLGIPAVPANSAVPEPGVWTLSAFALLRLRRAA